MIDRSYLGVDIARDSNLDVPNLDEVESEPEFAEHIMFYGYSQDEIKRLSKQQKRWLIRWG